jgi:homoserine kinase
MTISVFAPASIGNLSVGFDVLGLAVKPIDGTLLGDVVSVAHSAENQLTVLGRFADKLPQSPQQNIVWHCLQLFNQQRQVASLPVVPVHMCLVKNMPVGSGLGSSACSVVAALEGLNQFYQAEVDNGVEFTKQQLLQLMGQMEAKISGSVHYDNVAPCYLGGLQLMVPDPHVISRTLPSFEQCFYVMAYPGIEVSTKAAREVLPAQYSRVDLLRFGQNLATFVDACHRGDQTQAFAMLTDVVAEPYRQHLLPRYQSSKAHLLAHGALAVGISGSGPTLFAIYQEQSKAQQASQWLTGHYLQTELGFVHVCEIAQAGAGVVNESVTNQ